MGWQEGMAERGDETRTMLKSVFDSRKGLYNTLRVRNGAALVLRDVKVHTGDEE